MGMRVERRASPELFAFPPLDGKGDVPVEGRIVEALSLRPDLQDTAYRSLVQQRVEESALSAGARSRGLEKILQADEAGQRAEKSKRKEPEKAEAMPAPQAA